MTAKHLVRTPRSVAIDAAQANHWLVTRTALRERLLTDSMIRTMVGDGVLHPIVPGLYSVGRFRAETDQGLRAALLLIPCGAATRLTAAAIHRFPGLRRAGMEIVVPKGRQRDLPWLDIRQTRHLPAADVVAVGGRRTTTVARTVCDLGDVLHDRALGDLTKRLLVDRRVTRQALDATVRPWLRRGRNGGARVRRVLPNLIGSDALTQSALEDAFIDLLVGFGLPMFIPQFRPPWFNGVTGIADFGHPQAMILVECDGRPFHVLDADLARDKARDRTAALHDWITLRYSHAEIMSRPDEVAGELRLLLGQRAGRAPTG